MPEASRILSRAQGSLLGQLVGDALGSLVEFQTSDEIKRNFPQGVRELANGGTWDTLAGQCTDDSEMALALARTLVKHGTYVREKAFNAYACWLNSNPFDCGTTIASALRGRPDYNSQANGALMRVSPLGIFGASHDRKQLEVWARQDAALTHPNPVCQQANVLFACAIAHAVKTGPSRQMLYQDVVRWADELSVDPALWDVVRLAAEVPPPDFIRRQGWVLTALHNALWQLQHALSFEAAVTDTVSCGGDTDTNGAVCGALLGAVCGIDGIPVRWVKQVVACRPEAGRPHVHRPRPACYWPVDAMELAGQLVGIAAS